MTTRKKKILSFVERSEQLQKSGSLMQLNSVTKFLQLKNSMSTEDLEKHHPEFNSPKETSYYVFGKKTETYIKMVSKKAVKEHRTLIKLTKFVKLLDS